MAQLHAQPYDTSATGFYFDSLEDYNKKYAKNRNDWGGIVEEYMFQFIDGDDAEQALYSAMESGDFIDLKLYFELIDELDEDDLPKFVYLTEYQHLDAKEALERMEDVSLFHGTGEDYVYEFIEDIGVEGEWAQNYFDYEAFGREMQIEKVLTSHLYEDLETAQEELAEAEDEDEAEEAEYSIEQIQEHIDDTENMSEEDAGYYVVNEMYGGLEGLPSDQLKTYFDYDAYLRNMETNSEIAEFQVGGETYTVTNALDSYNNPRRNPKHTHAQLKNLNKDTLLQIAREYDLEVSKRKMTKDQIIRKIMTESPFKTGSVGKRGNPDVEIMRSNVYAPGGVLTEVEDWPLMSFEEAKEDLLIQVNEGFQLVYGGEVNGWDASVEYIDESDNEPYVIGVSFDDDPTDVTFSVIDAFDELIAEINKTNSPSQLDVREQDRIVRMEVKGNPRSNPSEYSPGALYGPIGTVRLLTAFQTVHRPGFHPTKKVPALKRSKEIISKMTNINVDNWNLSEDKRIENIEQYLALLADHAFNTGQMSYEESPYAWAVPAVWYGIGTDNPQANPRSNPHSDYDYKTIYSETGKKTRALQRHSKLFFGLGQKDNDDFEIVSMQQWIHSPLPDHASDSSKEDMKNVLLHKAQNQMSFGRLIEFNQVKNFTDQLKWFLSNGIKVTKRGISTKSFDTRSNPPKDFIHSSFDEFREEGTAGTWLAYSASQGATTVDERKTLAERMKRQYKKWADGGHKGKPPFGSSDKWGKGNTPKKRALDLYRKATFYLNILRRNPAVLDSWTITRPGGAQPHYLGFGYYEIDDDSEFVEPNPAFPIGTIVTRSDKRKRGPKEAFIYVGSLRRQPELFVLQNKRYPSEPAYTVTEDMLGEYWELHPSNRTNPCNESIPF